MPIKLEYDNTIDCMVMHVTGVVTYDDLPKLAAEIIQHNQFRENIGQLFDCTEGELSLSMEDLYKVANDFSGMGDVLGLNRKLALVASSDGDFGRFRQYEVFFQAGPEVKVHVFRSIEAARHWLVA